MPQAGNTMEEGVVVSWKVTEGDQIEVGQIICEIETDKATIEYESPEAGRLARIVAHEDETVPVKQPIAFLADNDADVDAHLAAIGTTAAAVAATSAGAAAASSLWRRSGPSATAGPGDAGADADRAQSGPFPGRP